MGKSIRYKVIYEDENKFVGLCKSLKHYNMKAYKEFIFDYLPKLREGEKPGESLGGKEYRIDLFTDDMFEFVHGRISIYYKVKHTVITITRIEPSEFLSYGRQRLLATYKGIPITSPRDKFMIDYYLTVKKK